MDGEAGRERGVRVGDLLESLHGDCGAEFRDRLLWVRGHSAVFHVRGRLGASADLLEDSLQALLEARHDLLGILNGDVTTTDQGFGIELADRPLLFDQVIHPRLGEARIIALIVTAAAIADEVDDDVFVEFLPERERQPSHPNAGLRIVTVYVEDRSWDHPSHASALHGGPSLV